ncbi:hypothetical protein [Embleya sp. NPDC005575]|uniref:hypothetical protein n=1 Tax=Embleya sp. NPDC005575 TaxID=3156892 RepID=UPI0033A73277
MTRESSDAAVRQVPETQSVLDRILAQTAFFLHEQGDVQAAALLLDVESMELVPGNRFGDWYMARLHVPGWLEERFAEEIVARISTVLCQVAERNGEEVQSVIVGTALPDVDANWRQTLQGLLSTDIVTNHAVRVSSPNPDLRRDGFVFESLEEVKVYSALKRAQSVLPSDATISIFPLPLGRVGAGNSWTPDFLIARCGKLGLLEVDGPHHRGRFGADATRDRHWRNSGIIHIERILVEETTDDKDLDDLVRAFLKRMRTQ